MRLYAEAPVTNISKIIGHRVIFMVEQQLDMFVFVTKNALTEKLLMFIFRGNEGWILYKTWVGHDPGIS